MITKIVPQGWLSALADILFFPIMWAFVLFSQAPNWTHYWNNKKRNPALSKRLNKVWCFKYFGNPKIRSRGIIRFHLPIIFGGWADFAVVRPTEKCDWFIGWTNEKDFFGYSQVRRKKGKPLKVLLGDGPMIFFALNEKGEQIPLTFDGLADLRRPSKFRWVPLR